MSAPTTDQVTVPSVPRGKELVGPLPYITFQAPGVGARVAYAFDVPRDTCDPRYNLCTDHHPACVCREAEHAETIGEQRHEIDSVRAAAQVMLRGHRLKHFPEDGWPDWEDRSPEADARREVFMRGAGPLACSCVGCRLIRASDLWVKTDMDGMVR